jgi:hypothetical protein
VSQLRNYSATLDTTANLINKPWAIIDEEFEMQKLIFKKDKELILSKNGQVKIGKWDYFPEAKSLLIDRNVDKILCNEAFIDNGVMILKLDGTENRFFILANENIVPDLDANKYLKALRYQKLKIVEKELVDGRILEIQRYDEFSMISIFNQVSMEADQVADGIYKIANSQNYYEIEKSRIKKILTETSYINPDGHEIVIQQQRNNKVLNGDYIFMYGKPLDTAILNFSKSKRIVVRNGQVVRLERKNPLMRRFSKFWKSTWGYYEN